MNILFFSSKAQVYKKLISISFLLFILFAGYSQTTIPEYPMSNATVTDCDGISKDSDALFGGKYDKDEDFTFTICPGQGTQVVFDFIFLQLEAVYDTIAFYNGPNTSSPFIAGWSGAPTGLSSIVATSGCMTIHFVSDGTLQLNGWEGMWQTIIDPTVAPTMTTASATPPACNSNSFVVEFSSNVHCDSIRTNNFRLNGTFAPNITNVQPVSCSSDSTRFARIDLSAPFEYNCTYDLEFDLKITDVCDSTWEFLLTDNFSFTTCRIPYTMSPSDTVCINQCGTVEVQTNTTCHPLTYSWNNGLPATAGPHSVCPAATTTYRVTITETNTGAQEFDSVTIFVGDTIPLDFDIQLSQGIAPTCGSPTFNVIFNPALPCYLLDSGNFILTNGYSAPNVISATALNCTSSFIDSVEVTLASPFSGNCNFNLDFDLQFYDNCNGQINLLLSDTFSINSCPLNATINYPDSICEGNCDTVSVEVNGCSTYTYTWSNGLPNSAGPHIICPIADTSFSVTILEDSTGLTYTEIINITVPPPSDTIRMELNPVFSPTCSVNAIDVQFSSPVNCANLSAGNFKIISGTDTLNLISGVTPTGCVGGVTSTATVNLTGSFTYNCDYIIAFVFDTVNVCGNAITFTSNDTINITDCPFNYTVNYNPLVCETTCTNVSVSVIESCFGLHYIWSNGLPDARSHNVCPLGDTTFTVTIIEDSTGISVTETITIEVDSSFDPVTIILDSTNYLPACDSTQLFIKFSRKVPCDSIYTSAFRLNGSNGNRTITNVTGLGCTNPGDSTQFATITIATPLSFYGVYRLYYYINGLECTTSVNVGNIRIEPHQTNFTYSDTCFYKTASFSAVVDSLTDMDSLKWNFGDPTSANNTSTSFNETHEYKAPGTYTVRLLVYYDCEIDTVIKQVVISNPLPINITGNTYLCPGISTTLDAGAGYTSYIWNTGAITQTIITDSVSTYSVIVEDGSGCASGRDTIQTTLGVDLTVNITGKPSFCPGTGTTLSTDSVFTSYAWSSGDITRDAYLTNTGTYTIIVKDALGCSGYDTVTVFHDPNLTVNITGPLSFCPGTGTTLVADSGFVSYAWSNGSTNQSISTNVVGPYSVIVKDTAGCSGYDTAIVFLGANLPTTITGNTALCPGTQTILDAGAGYVLYQWNTGDTTQSINNLGAGNYFVYVKDADGCSGYDTVDVIQYPDANLNITGDTNYCLGNFTMLNAGDGFTGYVWGHGDIGQEIMVSKADKYSIKVLDANSCFAYDTVTVIAQICIDTCNVIVPNAFSPNGDAVNDVFGPVVQSCDLEIFEFYIYDRWGQLIFQTKEYGIFWDGVYKNKLSQIDVFTWLIRFKSFDDPRIKTRTGHVTIIK